MKRLKFLAAALLAFSAGLATAGPISATPTAGVCSTSDITGAYACLGGLSGNDLGTPANVAAVGQQFATLGGFDTPFELIDNSNGTRGSQVALIYETGGKTGNLLLEDPTQLLPQSIFGISLKAGNFYSLYLFDGGIMNSVGQLNNLTNVFSSLSFTTAGTGVNNKGTPLGLSHASLWGTAPTNFGGSCNLGNDCDPVSQVPEPGSLALMGAGLLGLVFTARRRKA